MRVLVISLLRLGDFIQTLPVLTALKTQYPIRELDVLTHAPARMLQPMIGDVAEWWTIPREELQEGLGRGDLPLLTAFDVLKEKLDAMDARKYDLIINLTQTHFSGWIAGYLRAPNKLGMVFDRKGQPQLHSPWFQYLDEHAPLEAKDIFHYTDIFFYGSGLKGSERVWRLRETQTGRDEVDILGLGDGEKIVLQTLTSDAKKNWSEANWLKSIEQLHLLRPEARFILLGAPNESARLEPLLVKLLARGIPANKAILSLEGALALLNQAKLLITGDTSIKHLANASTVPILELSLGSSDYRRTGVYKEDSLILQPKVGCSPCPHSGSCSKSTHECAETLTPEVVTAAAHNLASGQWMEISRLAREFYLEVGFLRTKHLASGFWLAFDATRKEADTVITTVLERCTWKFLLNREHMNPVAQFGSEGIFMRRELSGIFSADRLAKLEPHLEFLEKQAVCLEAEAEVLLRAVKNKTADSQELKDFFRKYQPHSSVHSWIENLTFKEAEGAPPQIGSLRRVHSQLEQIVQQSRVKTKLIRSLKSQLTEFI